MSKQFTFIFNGTKDDFIQMLNRFPNNDNQFYFFNDYIIDMRDGSFRFGVARGGHSGGYWFIPAVNVVETGLEFTGKIEYIDSFSTDKMYKKIINKIGDFLLFFFLLPVWLVIWVYLFFKWIFRKVNGLPKEMTVEDNLLDLMENYLKCCKK